MSRDTGASPFSALSYQEQQDRWLEWRSRQLEFKPAGVCEETEETQKAAENPPPVHLPYLQQAAPTRHQNLDHVLQRHEQAHRQLSAFQPIGSGS